MAIEEKEVRHVAKLAKLTFADNEILHFTEQMSDIIDMVEQLNEVDTTGVPVTTHGILTQPQQACGWLFGHIRILRPCSGISLRTASIRRDGQPWRVVWHYILVT